MTVNSKSASFFMRALCALAVGFCVFAACLQDVCAMEEPDKLISDVPVTFNADEIQYNKSYKSVTARGNVEIYHNGVLLSADTVSYSMAEDIMTASGNVTLAEPDGNVMFAEYMELSGDLKTGVIDNLRLILSDKSQMVARSAQREDGHKNSLHHVVYTPCDLCETDKTRAPLWQVKAKKVVHDSQEQEVTYRNAWLEMWGVPVMYTPYLSHPGPEVNRLSGLLAPKIGGNSDLGLRVETPYYWAISTDRDVTLTPIFTSNQGMVMAGEVRRKFMTGEFEAEGSFTRDGDDSLRSHITGHLVKEHDRTWRTTVDVARASDDTYIRRYDFDDEGSFWLTTQADVEGFSHHNYARMRTTAFQDLREHINSATTPYVLPQLDYSFVGDQGRKGAYWTFDTNALVLGRSEGVQSRRLSMTTAWNLPYTSDVGDIYDFKASVRGDGYHVDNVRPTGASRDFDGFTGRVHPQMSLKWRFPLVRSDKKALHVVEPVVMGVVAPNGNNPEKIPNEDSRDLEFDDTNVLSDNRFVGYDRVESGSRMNYGLNWSIYGHETGRASVFVGQSYRFHQDALFPAESGLEKKLSDYVGRIALLPSDNIDMLYRFRLARYGLESRRNELTLNLGPPLMRLGLDYMFVNASNSNFTNYVDREEGSVHLSSALSRYWSAFVSHRHDLAEGGGPLEYKGGVEYEDECMLFNTTVEQTFAKDRDYEGGFSFMFTFVFKTLGHVKTGG